ncbi:hypothetical protein, partial [Faecalibaculum rodentium]
KNNKWPLRQPLSLREGGFFAVSFGCCSSACLESAEMRFTQVRLSRGKKSDMIPPDMKEAKICPVK